MRIREPECCSAEEKTKGSLSARWLLSPTRSDGCCLLEIRFDAASDGHRKR